VYLGAEYVLRLRAHTRRAWRRAYSRGMGAERGRAG